MREEEKMGDEHELHVGQAGGGRGKAAAFTSTTSTTCPSPLPDITQACHAMSLFSFTFTEHKHAWLSFASSCHAAAFFLFFPTDMVDDEIHHLSFSPFFSPFLFRCLLFLSEFLMLDDG